MHQLINLVLFQLVWLATVVGVSAQRPWLGGAALAFFLIVHAFISDTAVADYVLALIAATVGFVVDTLYVQTGLLSYEASLPWAGVAPFWILILWANLALTLNNGLNWLQGRYGLAALFGFIGGPLAYVAGMQIGAGALQADPLLAAGILAVSWAIIVPLLLFAARLTAEKFHRESDTP